VTQAIINAWYRGAWWLTLLRPLEWLYLRLRRLHLGRQPQPPTNPLPLLVVGNITIGGTGKTPLVVALVAALEQRGYKPAVISRGYGGNVGEGPHCIVPEDEAKMVGDEPLLLAQLTSVPVVVGWSRRAALTWLVQHTQCDLVISDDGLQHSAIKGDVEWCLVDASRGLGNGRCLPAGPLREPASRLAQVDKVIIMGKLHNKLEQALTQFVAVRDICQLQPQLDQLKRVDNDQIVPWPSAEKKINAIAAIGHPERFFNDLRSKGYQVHGQSFADHYQFKAGDLPTGELIMTAKDAVKCKSLVQKKQSDWLYASQTLTLPEALIETLIQQLELPSLGPKTL
jgi:tetraacyldisaccharide 4'-kinase